MKEDNNMKKLIFATAIILGLGFSACDSYLDINQDPNSPAEKDVNSSMLLPAAWQTTERRRCSLRRTECCAG